ncbi:MAG: hypothetical protein Q7S56_01050 [Nanoarchaeota archaeon]|nr:hypothetical protein [Nanoarchaeota archaeon]
MDKHGGEKLLSVWWFAILVIVGVGVSAGIIIFYSASIDVRDYEAEILNKQVQNCFVNGNSLVDNFKTIDILKDCNLDPIIFDKGSDYFVKVYILDSDGKDLRDVIVIGDSSKEADCPISSEIPAKHISVCKDFNKRVYYGDSMGMIKILTASNQEGGKVKL